MRRFWEPVIEPLLDAVAARRIIEIGAGRGKQTVRIARWCRRHGATLDVIDPAPQFDAALFGSASVAHVRIHVARSLDVLAGLLPADVVIIDGDHNWYSVYNELGTVYRGYETLPGNAPIAVCHDVAWPYGSRDQYCDPDSIPAEFRQPHGRGGPVPDQAGLLPNGIHADSWHAVTEGGPRNGVRTAIVDALADRRDAIRIVWLDVRFGLAIIVPLGRIAAHPELGPLLDRLELSANWRRLAALLEHERIVGAIAVEQLKALTGSAPVVPVGGRDFSSSLPDEVQAGIQRGLVDYRYKGRQMMLHPLDMANYLALLGSLRPGTIFEIGTREGGRAIWLADMAMVLGIGARVVALDLDPPAGLDHPGVSVVAGDARNLAASFDRDTMAALPRPFLVIEDSAHDEHTCLAVLGFFDCHLRPGDMIVVEDGLVSALLSTEGDASGPSAAIARFLSARGDDYAIDVTSCDRFGYNATGNPNGWLRRV
jgi:cephalosporin hydroxylase